MIYVLKILGGRFIKVGFTSSDDVSSRIAQLQTGCPFEISAVMTVNGTLRQEKELHKALELAYARCFIPIPPNEWYPQGWAFFRRFLDALKYGPNQAMAYLDTMNPDFKRMRNNGDNRKSPDVVKEWPKGNKKLKNCGM